MGEFNKDQGQQGQTGEQGGKPAFGQFDKEQGQQGQQGQQEFGQKGEELETEGEQQGDNQIRGEKGQGGDRLASPRRVTTKGRGRTSAAALSFCRAPAILAAMKRNLLRSRDSHSEERVGFIELFFDLVFVFAVTQVSHAIILHPDPLGFVQAGLLFLAIWWVWVDTAWVTNWLDVRHMPVRFLLFALMGAALVMTISLPQAFGAARCPSRSLMSASSSAATASCCSRSSATTATISSTSCGSRSGRWSRRRSGSPARSREDVAMRMALWGVALAIVSTGPVLAFWTPGLGRSETRTWDVEGHHFSERCGLFIIIALGESILVTGAAFGQTDWAAPAIAAFASAFVGTIAMWWLYFDIGAERAAEAAGSRTRIRGGWRGSPTPISTSRSSPGSSSPRPRIRWR